MRGESVGAALGRWLAVHSLGRKPRSVEFNAEIHDLVLRFWPGALNAAADSVTPATVADFAQRVTHYCPSRWNAIVGAVKFVAPQAARDLRRRPLRAKERATVSREDFAKLLEELDQAPKSHAGLVVRFLAQTGLRINEARQVRWADIFQDYLRLPGSFTKNSHGRVVPFIPGTAELLEQLRAVTGDKERVLPQSECKTALRSACLRLGLPRLSHHDFRHLFVTRAIESGVDLPTLARWVGHQDGGALLARRYFHLLDSHSKAMAAKVQI